MLKRSFLERQGLRVSVGRGHQSRKVEHRCPVESNAKEQSIRLGQVQLAAGPPEWRNTSYMPTGCQYLDCLPCFCCGQWPNYMDKYVRTDKYVR